MKQFLCESLSESNICPISLCNNKQQALVSSEMSEEAEMRLWLPNIYFKKISYSKNTYMIYENDQLTKLIKNTKNDTYLDGMTSDIVVNW